MKQEGQNQTKTYLQDYGKKNEDQGYSHNSGKEIGILLREDGFKVLEAHECFLADIDKLDIKKSCYDGVQHRIEKQQENAKKQR